MAIKLSRGPSIDTEICVEKIGNRFDLVLVASARVRELYRLHKHSESREHDYPVITALAEIQEGKVGREYLKRIR